MPVAVRTRSSLKIEDLTYLIDTREQTPFDFASMDPRIRTASATLPTGDYSIRGLEHLVTVERKSLDDLIGCVGRGRERFERELQRMKSYTARCVVVECSWDALEFGDYRSQITPKALTGSVMGWMEMGILFFFARNATEAARFTANFMFISARRRFRELQALGDHLPLVTSVQAPAVNVRALKSKQPHCREEPLGES